MTLPLLALWTALLAPAAMLQDAPKTAPISHAAFSDLLHAHVRSGLVDYDAFAKSKAFEDYLLSLVNTKVDLLSKNDRLAFWINAYNAYTIQLVNKHEERSSIRNINKLLGVVPTRGPWNEPIVRAGGRFLTLDELENTILRAEFKNPRVHFALSTASNGGPPLRYEAYEGKTIDEQLEDQTRLFLRQKPGLNELDVVENTLRLSKLFDEYKDDFGGSTKTILKFVAPYFPGEAEEAVLTSKKLKIRFVEPDWDLNIQTHLKQ